MYSVIDIRQNPPIVVQGTENFSEQECIAWIKEFGNIIDYSIQKTI